MPFCRKYFFVFTFNPRTLSLARHLHTWRWCKFEFRLAQGRSASLSSLINLGLVSLCRFPHQFALMEGRFFLGNLFYPRCSSFSVDCWCWVSDSVLSHFTSSRSSLSSINTLRSWPLCRFLGSPGQHEFTNYFATRFRFQVLFLFFSCP